MQAGLDMVASLALVEVKGAAVGNESRVPDECLGFFDAREAVILQHVFLDDDAVDVVGAAVQAEFT